MTTMTRKGSLVRLDAGKVAAHPVYSKVIGCQWKVVRVENGYAYLGNGTRIPLNLLVGIPQKKGKAA
jgi:hypothetical protein